MELDQFIPLSQNHPWRDSKDAISHIAVTQQLWFAVMGNNPSYFKQEKYCPGNYKVLGKTELCWDFPVEMISVQSGGVRDSTTEFLVELNRIFIEAGLDVQFRLQADDEFLWGDMARGSMADEVTDAGPLAPAQSYAVKSSFHNERRFYRSSVLELTSPGAEVSYDWCIDRAWAVGRSWREKIKSGVPHLRHVAWKTNKKDDVGFRIVRTQLLQRSVQ
jgi:hypothetical protein